MNIKKICCAIMAATMLTVSVPVCVLAKTPAKSNLSILVSELKKDKSVKQYTVSHDSQKIAIVRGASTTGYALYVMTVAGKTKSRVANIYGSLYDPKWSYNDKYISVEDGTAVSHTTDIATVSTLRRRWAVNGVTGMVWAHNSNTIAFSVVNKAVKQAVATELNGATEVIIYNIDKIKYRRIIKADSQFDYSPVKWDNSGLTIKKSHLVGGKTEALKFNFSK